MNVLSVQRRIRLRQMYESGASVGEVVVELDIWPNTVRTYFRKFKEGHIPRPAKAEPVMYIRKRNQWWPAPYTGPHWIGKSITPAPDRIGRNWIGKVIP